LTKSYGQKASDMAFALNKKHVSLTVGKPEQILALPRQVLVWSSNNKRVKVDNKGTVIATEDAMGKNSRALITARTPDGRYSDTCEATIVNWAANSSELKIVDKFPPCTILAQESGSIYFSKGKELYKTTDGMKSRELISELPDMPTNMLITQFGYFLRSRFGIYRSLNLKSWQLSHATQVEGKHDSFNYYYNSDTQTGYIYAGEYSVDNDNRHRVYRGSIYPDGSEKWDMILEFNSINEWTVNKSILNAARHIHTVTTDPYTGQVWVATGDMNIHNRILFSDDNGESFKLVGMGSDDWKTLSIWFTRNYVYWNMDSISKQSIWRIPRKIYNNYSCWPVITPNLTSGKTRKGVKYYITKNRTPGHFPAATGEIYVEKSPRPLNQDNSVMAFNDFRYDYRERVMELCTGSHWYYCWVKEESGQDIVIMSTSPESTDPITGEYPGTCKDWRGRVFGIKELPDGKCDVQELISVPPKVPNADPKVKRYTQLEPKLQDENNYIYLRCKNVETDGVYKAILIWKNNSSHR
jgi:hypothetical protein